MESEGPYRMVGGMFEGPNGFSFRIVWGPDFRLDENIVCEEIIKIANQAHCEGRKSERERWAKILAYAQHRDSCGDMDAHNNADAPSCNCGLDGLKDEIRGGQDAK